MPYTPPSQQSPASSKPNTPAISRSSSYTEDGPRSPAIGRPSPPRSMSASYLHRHRRSPSIAKSDGAPPTPAEAPDSTIKANDFAHNGSVRQSPPPLNNLLIPTGAVISPPDSSENSDGDEGSSRERGRELERNWTELREAVRGINQKREGSPDNSETMLTDTPISEPVSSSTSPTQLHRPSALTAEARKISHSRSSTEIYIPRQQFSESPTQTSEDSDEDENLHIKPSLVRKKSGELVKPALRPSSRRRYSSMPGTPTYNKSVHFNEDNNQTRHFLQVDKPIAVSAGASPVETYDSESEFPFEAEDEREIKLSNFPADTFDQRTKPIRVERIFLSPDKHTLIGVCAVQNIAFHKLVVARFTLDNWKTTSEVVAEYNNDPKSPNADGCDRFNFHIKLSDQANIDAKTLLLCVRYNVGGQEFWDNNNDSNYQIDFTKVSKKPSKPQLANGLGARPLNAIPRSRHSPPATARGQRESLDDDFAARFDSNSAYNFSSADTLLGESPNSVKLKPRSKRGSVFPTTNGTPATNGLGGRYDFGASLSAALSSAQDKLGRQSGLMNSVRKPGGGSYFAPIERTDGPAKLEERPDAITTDRPAMGSDQYKDLVQKFCYFTPGTGKQAATAPQPQTTKSKPSGPTKPADGANDDRDDEADDSTASSPDDSGSSSPVYTSLKEYTSPKPSPFASRSASPAPFTGGGMGGRVASPISFGYPYHHNIRDGYLSDSQTPTAIHG